MGVARADVVAVGIAAELEAVFYVNSGDDRNRAARDDQNRAARDDRNRAARDDQNRAAFAPKSG